MGAARPTSRIFPAPVRFDFGGPVRRETKVSSETAKHSSRLSGNGARPGSRSRKDHIVDRALGPKIASSESAANWQIVHRRRGQRRDAPDRRGHVRPRPYQRRRGKRERASTAVTNRHRDPCARISAEALFRNPNIRNNAPGVFLCHQSGEGYWETGFVVAAWPLPCIARVQIRQGAPFRPLRFSMVEPRPMSDRKHQTVKPEARDIERIDQ